MKAEIFSIGTELLLGQIIDTNAVFFSERLALLGIPLYYRQTVGDNHERLTESLKSSLKRSDIIICSGGIGPTEDDITTECVAKAFNTELYLDESELKKLHDLFTSRGRTMTKSQRKQASLPVHCTVIPNPTGTAPGFILEKDGKIAIVLPGPPKEMTTMWYETVDPYLNKYSDNIIYSLTARFCGIGEATLEEELLPIIHSEEQTTIAPYAKRSEVHIRLTSMQNSIEKATMEVNKVLTKIKKLNAGKYIYGYNDETLEFVVAKLLDKKELKLTVAESCTGGRLGSRLTEIPGSSSYFLGGIIAYSNEIKEQLLKVNYDTLNKFGAVSSETAIEMANGVKKLLGADIGVSITGIAGPDGETKEKPIGTVYIGLSFDKKTFARHFHFWGRRDDIRYRATQEALRLIWEELNK